MPLRMFLEAKYEHGTIDVLDMGLVDMAQLKRGSFRYVRRCRF